MLTHIGRVAVITTSYRRNGWLLWETAVVVYFPNPEGHWCGSEPTVDVFDRYLTQAESWIGHALIVGYMRCGLELEQAEPAFLPVLRRIGGRVRVVYLTLTQYRDQESVRASLALHTAELAWGIHQTEGGITAAPVPPEQEPEPRVKSA